MRFLIGVLALAVILGYAFGGRLRKVEALHLRTRFRARLACHKRKRDSGSWTNNCRWKRPACRLVARA